MNAISVDNKGHWVIMSQSEIPMALEIVLFKRTVVLSWSQFVFAEGSDDEIRIEEIEFRENPRGILKLVDVLEEQPSQSC